MKIAAAMLALFAIVHFVCVCNFMPAVATKKAKLAALSCVACGAMLLGCVLGGQADGVIGQYAIALGIALSAYEISTWMDGMTGCDFYRCRGVKPEADS